MMLAATAAEPRTEAEWRAHYLAVRKRLNTVPLPKAVRLVEPPYEWISAQDVIPPSIEFTAIRSERGVNRVATILNAASRHFGIPVSEILSRRHLGELVRPRHIAMYLSLHLTNLSYPAVGRFMGRRDHTTVMNGVRRIRDRLEWDRQLAADVGSVRALAIEADPQLGAAK